MWKVFQRDNAVSWYLCLANKSHDRIFSQSLNLLESYIRMKQDERMGPFRWMIDGHSSLHAASYIVSVLEDTQSSTTLDGDLLQKGKQLLRNMKDIHANTDSKVVSLLQAKINNLTMPEFVETEPSGREDMDLTLLPDVDVANLDDWINDLGDFM